MRIRRLLLSGCLLTTFLAADAEPAPHTNFEIVTLSNRADLISGGDALVEVRVPKTVPLKKVTLWLNGARRDGGVPDQRRRRARCGAC